MEQAFAPTWAERRNGLLMLGITLLLLGVGVLIAVQMWSKNPLLAVLGLVFGCAAGGLAGRLALGLLWPRRLVVAEEYGALQRAGRAAVEWRWDDGSHIDWQQTSTSRYAPEQPVLVLANGEVIELDQFGMPAYQAVRERLLWGGWVEAGREP